MSPYWSGAIIYEWIQETNHYGLVAYGSMTDGLASPPATVAATAIPRSGTPTPVTPDFSNLKSVWASVSPSAVSANAYHPSLTNPPCPGITNGLWYVNGDVALPQLGASLDGSAMSSITATGARATASTSATASPSATGKKGDASSGKEVAGVAVGLMTVVFGFMWWL